MPVRNDLREVRATQTEARETGEQRVRSTASMGVARVYAGRQRNRSPPITPSRAVKRGHGDSRRRTRPRGEGSEPASAGPTLGRRGGRPPPWCTRGRPHRGAEPARGPRERVMRGTPGRPTHTGTREVAAAITIVGHDAHRDSTRACGGTGNQPGFRAGGLRRRPHRTGALVRRGRPPTPPQSARPQPVPCRQSAVTPQ